MTISRGIPELYLLSTEDSHVRAMDPKSNYVARRRDIASNQVFLSSNSRNKSIYNLWNMVEYKFSYLIPE